MTVALGIVVLAGAVLCVGALGWLHVVGDDYSPLRDPVSAYGAGPLRRGYAVAAISIGIAGAAAAFALAHAVPEASTRVVALLLVFAAARVAIPWFPLDTRRAAHALLALLAFASICAAAVRLGAQVRWDVRRVLEVLGWVASGGAAATMLAVRLPPLRPVLGLLERVFYAAMLLWFLLVGLHLARFG